MEQILNKIKEKIMSLKQMPFPKEEDLPFLMTFLEDYQLTYEKVSLIHIRDNCEMLLGVMVGKNIMPYPEAKKLLENPELKNIINNLKNDKKSSEDFIDDIANLEEYGIDTIKYLAFKSDIFYNSHFIDFIKRTRDLALLDCLTLFIIIKREVASIKLEYPIKQEQKKEISDLISVIKTNSDIKLYDYLTGRNIRHRINNLKREKELFKEEIANKVSTYQQIYNYLSGDILIENIDFIDKIDDDMKQCILEGILLHNEKYYLEISQQRLKYNNEIRGIFKLNGFNFDKLETSEQQRLLENNDINNVRTILPIIKKEPFFIGIDDCYLVDILLYSTNNIIIKITNLYKKGYIDINFIQQNKGILFSNKNSKNTGLYEFLKNNLRVLRDNKLDIKAIQASNPQVLLMNTNDLFRIVQLFKKYQINLNNQPGNDYSYLTNKNIFGIIDLFIELGHEKFAKNNLRLLSHLDENTVKRIYISSMIIDDCDKIDDYILQGTTYPIKNEHLDNFIINHTPQYINPDIIIKFEGYQYEVTPTIECLDKYFQSDNVYFFDDIVISRNKVIRNLTNYQSNNKLDEESFMTVLLNAIINNSILESEQINTIMHALNKAFSGKKKIL